jgi:hypothetical protein
MRRNLLLVALSALCIALPFASSGDEAAVAPDIATKFDLAYVSKYVWRGIPQTSEGAV